MAEGLYRLWKQAGADMEVLPQLQMEGMFTGECRWCEFDFIYKDWAQVNVAADDKLAWQNTRLITQKWIEAHPHEMGVVRGWPFTVTHVKVPFEVPLTTVDGVEVMFVGLCIVTGNT